MRRWGAMGLSKKKGEACHEHHRWHLKYCFAPTCGVTHFEKCSFWTAPSLSIAERCSLSPLAMGEGGDKGHRLCWGSKGLGWG